MIEFKDVCVTYENKKKEKTVAVKDFSLNINDGEIIVILGASGSGKTSIIKALAGIIPYDNGNIFLNGNDILSFSIKDRNMSFASQQTTLYSMFDVYHNIAIPLRSQHVPYDEIDRRVKEIANKLDISFLLSRKPFQLSEGQKQKVNLARCMIKKPSILLLDEPFANLDKENKMNMHFLIKEIHKSYNPTIFFVTHDVHEAMFLADRIVIMDNGKIIQVGTPKEITNNSHDKIVNDLLKAGGIDL